MLRDSRRSGTLHSATRPGYLSLAVRRLQVHNHINVASMTVFYLMYLLVISFKYLTSPLRRPTVSRLLTTRSRLTKMQAEPALPAPNGRQRLVTSNFPGFSCNGREGCDRCAEVAFVTVT